MMTKVFTLPLTVIQFHSCRYYNAYYLTFTKLHINCCATFMNLTHCVPDSCSYCAVVGEAGCVSTAAAPVTALTTLVASAAVATCLLCSTPNFNSIMTYATVADTPFMILGPWAVIADAHTQHIKQSRQEWASGDGNSVATSSFSALDERSSRASLVFLDNAFAIYSRWFDRSTLSDYRLAWPRGTCSDAKQQQQQCITHVLTDVPVAAVLADMTFTALSMSNGPRPAPSHADFKPSGSRGRAWHTKFT